MSRSAVFAATLLSVAALLGSTACLPSPSHDFEEFLDDTASLRSGSSGGGSSVDGGVPTEAREGTYLAACLASISGTRVDRALRFYAESKYLPGDDGGLGKLSLTLLPLKVSARTFSKSEEGSALLTVGEEMPLTEGAKFSAQIAEADIALEANAISERAILMTNIDVNGVFAAEGNFCSSFNGKVVKPLNQQINARCIYIPMEEGDTFEVIRPTATESKSALVVGGVEYEAPQFGCAD